MVMGRPSKYEPEMCAKAIALMAQGDSKEVVCAELGIAKSTLYEWCDPEGDYYIEDFSNAIKHGMTLCQRFWERQLQKAALGTNPDANATLMIFNMKNRFREQWSDMQVHEQRHSFVVLDEPVKESSEWLADHKPK